MSQITTKNGFVFRTTYLSIYPNFTFIKAKESNETILAAVLSGDLSSAELKEGEWKITLNTDAIVKIDEEEE